MARRSVTDRDLLAAGVGAGFVTAVGAGFLGARQIRKLAPRRRRLQRPQAVAFDVIGTFFSLEALRARLVGAGLPAGTLELWIARILRDGFGLDAAGVFTPFRKIAVSALEALFAEHGLERTRAEARQVVRGFAELEAYPDGAAALLRLRRAGVKAIALTNGSPKTTKALFERAGLIALLDEIVSIEEIGRWKPRPEIYRHGARRAGVPVGSLALVAAHGWDIQGASNAGLMTGYVERPGRPFPTVMGQPDVTGAMLDETVEKLLAL